MASERLAESVLAIRWYSEAQACDALSVDVEANDVTSELGESNGVRGPYVTRTDDRNFCAMHYAQNQILSQELAENSFGSSVPTPE
jgi:hypothetical protein